ncbi:hypothetical protein J6590_094226 [Homalodisca vitripennis]|nr:hypothetical protein J6590_094226 [Homalodisca vitripennis]
MLYLLLLSLLFVGESSTQLVNETEETPVPDGADGDLSSLKAENRKLEREKIRLTEECQKDIDYWSKLYNDTYNSLSHDMPEVAELEKKLSEAVAKEDRLDKAVEELGTHTKLFYLKKISLRGTIDFLVKYEDDAQTCINHGDYIGFQRNLEKKALRPALRSRALSTRRRSLLLSRQAVDNTEVEKERQNILMDIMIQQEKYKNEELKAYIEYYSLYCQRNVQHYQDLLESLKRWPEAKVLVQQIEEEIQRENERITNKTQNLLDERNKLQSIISELMKLQEEYDRLRDAADCFDRLNKWPIADALASLQGNLQGVLNFRPNQIEDKSHFALTKVIDKYNKNGYTSIKTGSRYLL